MIWFLFLTDRIFPQPTNEVEILPWWDAVYTDEDPNSPPFVHWGISIVSLTITAIVFAWYRANYPLINV